MNRREFWLNAFFPLAVTAFGVKSVKANSEVLRHKRRLAFVVGNSNYRSLPILRNPGNDARSIAGALDRAGFELYGDEPLLNLSNHQLQVELDQFAGRIDDQSVVIFYFAGHGFQQKARNFLAGIDTPGDLGPVDADLPSRGLARVVNGEEKVFSADILYNILDTTSSLLNIIVLDACRNNPFPKRRDVTASLARTDAPKRTLISYATQPGNVALDGAGDNSPYTASLVNAMSMPGSTILEVFNNTGLNVQEVTNGRQVPWVSLSPIPSRLVFSDLLSRESGDRVPKVCVDSVEAMILPIKQLFDAWAKLDIDQYDRQWSANSFQVAGKVQRDRKLIVGHRRRIFGRLKSVRVAMISPQLVSQLDNIATFTNSYTMHFKFRNGRELSEKDIKETYTVICEGNSWRIKENFDYLDAF